MIYIHVGGDLNCWSMKNILPQQCIFTGKVELHPDVYGPHSPEADAAARPRLASWRGLPWAPGTFIFRGFDEKKIDGQTILAPKIF